MTARTILLGVLAAAVTATTAAAQAPPGPVPANGYGPPMRDGGGRDPARAERGRQMMEAHRQRREAELRAVLQLRPEQEAAFQQFTAAVRPETGPGRRGPERDGAMGAPMTTLQRLDRMQARMQERQARFARVADATRRFYAVLSPAQQRALDAIPGHMGHRHGGWGGERGRGPGGGRGEG